MPEGEEEAQFIRRLGESSREMQGTLAWRFFYDHVVLYRESCVQRALKGGEGADGYGKVALVLGEILKVPAKLVEDGKNARES